MIAMDTDHDDDLRMGSSPPIDRGVPGRSAHREHDRRAKNDEERTRARHHLLGGLLLRLNGERNETRAWSTGGLGEEIVGRRLNALSDRGVIAIHDRRVPRGRANIDHIAIGPSGVYVIDTKLHRDQRIHLVGMSPVAQGPKLFVGRWNRTEYLTKVHGQVDVLRTAVGDLGDVRIVPMLVFVEAQWPIWCYLGEHIDVGNVLVRTPRQMAKVVSRPGPLDPGAVEKIARRISDRLVAA